MYAVIQPLKCKQAPANKPVEKSELASTDFQTAKISHSGLPTASDPNSIDPIVAALPLHPHDVLTSELADDPDMAPLIKTYVGKFTSKINLMNDYLANNRLHELARLAHQLKGTGGGYGFPSISDAACRVEQEAQSNSDVQQIQIAVSELTDLCQKAIAGCIESVVAEPNAFGARSDS